MTGAACRFAVRITPRAAREEVQGWLGEVLRVRVTAPPVDQRANEALLQLLALRLDVPASDLRVVQGETSRLKVVAVEGLALDEVRSRLDAPAR